MKIIVPILFLFCLSCNGSEKVDPYEIIQKKFDKVSDLNLAERSYHKYGYSYINDSSNAGKFEEWIYGNCHRSEDYWNGIESITIINDTLIYKIVDGNIEIDSNSNFKLLLKISHLIDDPTSYNIDKGVFKLKYLGNEVVNNLPCYIIEIRNNFSDIISVQYIDTLNLLIQKDITKTEEFVQKVYLYDYKKVAGEYLSFKRVFFYDNNSLDSVVYIYDSILVNQKFDKALFEFPVD